MLVDLAKIYQTAARLRIFLPVELEHEFVRRGARLHTILSIVGLFVVTCHFGPMGHFLKLLILLVDHVDEALGRHRVVLLLLVQWGHFTIDVFGVLTASRVVSCACIQDIIVYLQGFRRLTIYRVRFSQQEHRLLNL